MVVELALIVCLDVTVRATCTPRSFAHSPITTLHDCYGPLGQNIVRDYLSKNAIKEPWHFGGVQCEWGNRRKSKTNEA